MQVVPRQRAVSLVEMRKPGNTGRCPSGCRPMQAASRRYARGFTLIELMITLAVALVLIMIAVPSFKNLILANRLTTTANDVVGAISIARMEAIKRNANTQLCGNTANGSAPLGTSCTPVGAVYVAINGAAVQVRAGTVGLATQDTVQAIRFSGQGLGRAAASTAPFTGLVADISTTAMSTNNHRCINMTTGSIIAVTTTSGACK